MNITQEEQLLLDTIKPALKETGTKMDYYTLIYRLEKAGFAMPKRYTDLFDTSPSVLVRYNEETTMIEGFTEDETKVLEAKTFADFQQKAAVSFPNHRLEKVEDIPHDEEPERRELFDSRFRVNTYRLDLNDYLNKATLFINYKKGTKTGKAKVSQAFYLVDSFFTVAYQSEGRKRKHKGASSTSTIPPGRRYDTYALSPEAGYKVDGRAFIALPVFRTMLPVHSIPNLKDYETINVYGSNMDEAYLNAAQYIVENYEWNSEPKNV